MATYCDCAGLYYEDHINKEKAENYFNKAVDIFATLAKENPDCEFVPVWISNMNNVLPKGFILPIPLLCDLYVGEPLKIGTDETKEVFLTRAQSALLSLNVSEKGKS